MGDTRTREELLAEIARLSDALSASNEAASGRARGEVEAELIASERRFRLLTENVPGVVYLCKNDERYTMLYVNDQMEQLTGYTKDDFLADRICFQDLFHPDDAKELRAEVDLALAQRRSYVLSYRMRHRDGTWRWIEEFGTGVWTDDRLEYLEGFLRDVTERRRAQEERQRLEARIARAQQLESLEVLAGGVAHDFNNLLVGILGNAGLVLDRLPEESAAREGIHRIEAAARRAAELCGKMLAYSGRGRFEIEPLSLEELVSDTADLLEVTLERRGALHIVPPEDELPQVAADAHQIRQVLVSLVSNAADSLGAGDGVVRISTGEDYLNVSKLGSEFLVEPPRGGGFVWVDVADNGCGIPGPLLSRILDPFFSTKPTGRGLGLAAVRGMVRAHQGGLSVTSDPGRGTAVRVYLPIEEPLEEDEEPTFARWPQDGQGRVLVVDDEETVRQVATAVLVEAGYEVEAVENGSLAVRAVAQNPTRFDVVLLDLTMPGMDGGETLEELRRVREDLPVVLTSGYDARDTLAAWSGSKSVSFLKKPYEIAELIGHIRAFLGNGPADGR